VYSKAEADAQTLALAYSKSQIDSLNDNPIINPCMEMWQRGTGFASAASGTYTADRWNYQKSGAMVHDVARSTVVPTVAEAGVAINFSLYTEVTTADAAIAAGDYCSIVQRIEGYNWRHFTQRALTLSFWVRATVTGTYCIALTNTVDRTFLAEYTINTTDTWEKKTINIPASPSAGTWDYTNGIGAELRFVLACGTTFQSTVGWTNGNFIGTNLQVNATGTVGNLFRLTGVKLELGSIATPLRYRSFQQELALCNRYYEKSYDYAVAPGSVSNPGAFGFESGGDIYLWASYRFAVRKRATPTLTLYSTVTGNSGNIRNDATAADQTVSSIAGIGEQGYYGIVLNAATTAGYDLTWQWTANAEL
jgi:hypothetical protein